MSLSVREKAEYLGTFRWIEVFLMETVSRWVPTTPELEAKVLLGRHVWELAQHADGLGKRTFELRAPLHFNLPPPEGYQVLLGELASLDGTTDRILSLYDAILPALEARYNEYLRQTDSLLDEPSVRVVESILLSIARMKKERTELLAGVSLPAATSAVPEAETWLGRENACAPFVAHGQGQTLARGAQA